MPTPRSALVTGGNRGIGRATCVALAQAGVDVAFTYRDEASAAETRALVEAAGGRCLMVKASMEQVDMPLPVVDAVVRAFGGLNFLVCNAGTIGRGSCVDVTDEEWDRIIAVNLSAPFRYCRAAIPHLRPGGAIVLVGSTAGLQGAGPAHYVASKAGLVGLSRALARELASKGITVNVVAPGFVDTGFHGSPPQSDIIRHQAARAIPLGRLATPDEVAQAVVYALNAQYVTGATLSVAGGLVMT